MQYRGQTAASDGSIEPSHKKCGQPASVADYTHFLALTRPASQSLVWLNPHLRVLYTEVTAICTKVCFTGIFANLGELVTGGCRGVFEKQKPCKKFQGLQFCKHSYKSFHHISFCPLFYQRFFSSPELKSETKSRIFAKSALCQLIMKPIKPRCSSKAVFMLSGFCAPAAPGSGHQPVWGQANIWAIRHLLQVYPARLMITRVV